MAHAANACSWLLAAALARRCGPRYQLREMHPGGGQYDCLTFVMLGAGDRVDLNRAGRIHVHQRRSVVVVGGDDPWTRLAQGTVGVRALADEVAAAAGWEQPRRPLPTAPVVAAIATAVRSAALFGVPWHVGSGWLDSSGTTGSDLRRELFGPYANQFEDGLEHALSVPERYWFLTAGQDQQPASDCTAATSAMP